MSLTTILKYRDEASILDQLFLRHLFSKLEILRAIEKMYNTLKLVLVLLQCFCLTFISI